MSNNNSLLLLIFVLALTRMTYSMDTEDLFQTRDFITPIFKSIKRNEGIVKEIREENGKEPNKKQKEKEDPEIEENHYVVLRNKRRGCKQERVLKTDKSKGKYLTFLFIGSGDFWKDERNSTEIVVFKIRDKNTIGNVTFKVTERYQIGVMEFDSSLTYSVRNVKRHMANRDKAGFIFKVLQSNISGTDFWTEKYERRKTEDRSIRGTVSHRHADLYWKPVPYAQHVYGVWVREDRDEHPLTNNLAMMMSAIDAEHDKFFICRKNGTADHCGKKTHRGKYTITSLVIFEEVVNPDTNDTFWFATLNDKNTIKVEEKLWKIIVTCGAINIGSVALIIYGFWLSDKYLWKGAKAEATLTKFQKDEQKEREEKAKADQKAGEDTERPTIGINSEGQEQAPEQTQ